LRTILSLVFSLPFHLVCPVSRRHFALGYVLSMTCLE
jgi:hypothetical protein